MTGLLILVVPFVLVWVLVVIYDEITHGGPFDG